MNRELEDAAAVILERLLGGTAIQVDPGGGAIQLRDFDLHLGDGRIAAAEVTSFVDGRERALWSNIEKRAGAANGLDEAWLLRLLDHANVKEVVRRAPQLLNSLGGFGATAFDTGSKTGSDAIDELLEELRVLAIRFGRMLPGVGEPFLGFSTGSAGSTGPSVITDAVRSSLDAGNVAKLASAETADERHLFVWVDHSQYAAHAAMHEAVLPLGPPLPSGIDVVWVARIGGYEDHVLLCDRLWRLDSTGWADVGVTATKEFLTVDLRRFGRT